MAEVCYNTDCPYWEFGKCTRTATCITQPDGYWYHGNGKLGGEFHPNKPNDEERYGEYVKVKHGRWLKTGQSFVYPDKFRNYFCSICGFELDTHIRQEPNYCPNCGADMRGEKNDKR